MGRDPPGRNEYPHKSHISSLHGKWVSWVKPPSCRVKLNTDGSRRGTHTTDGGVLQDANGDVILAFAVPFSLSDVLQAELDALLQGLILCAERGFFQVEVEIDSATAFNMTLRKVPEAWNYTFSIRKIRERLAPLEGLYLTTRQANMVADGLAKWAYTMDEMVTFQNLDEIPRVIQKLIFIDRVGLPYFRPKYN